MCTSGSHDNMLVDGPVASMRKCGGRRAGLLHWLAVLALGIFTAEARAQPSDWELPAIESHLATAASRWTPSTFDTNQQRRSVSTVKLLGASEVIYHRKAEPTIAPAEFEQPASENPP